MAVTNRRTELFQTAVALPGGMKTGLIWQLADGTGQKESNLFGVAGNAGDALGSSLDEAGDQTKIREPGKALNENDALGQNLVVNGQFLADTDWTKGTGWTIANGVADCDGVQVAASSLLQAITFVPTNSYRVSFRINVVSAGDVTPVVGDTDGTARSTVGTFTEIIIAGVGSDFELEADALFVGEIDNVSVRELI